MVIIKACYRVEEQLQEFQDLLSRKNSHLLGPIVLRGERQLLNKAERKLTESILRKEIPKLVRTNSQLP